MQRELLESFIKGEASVYERERVVEWIDESDDNFSQYIALRRLNDILIWREDEITKLSVERSKKSFFASLWRKRLTYAGITAMLVVCFLAFYIPTLKQGFSDVQYSVIEVPPGQRTHIKLSDGTSVWLNSNTRLSLPSDFSASKRSCIIDGEAFFDVKKDPKHPFVVGTSRYELNVTGTSFNVLAFSGSKIFETSLMSGNMTVASKENTGKKYALKPNQTMFEDNKSLYTKPIEEESFLMWKDGIYMFNDQDFAYIFKMLEKYYDVKIVVNNTKVLSYRCTGKFRQKEHIGHIMKVLQKDNSFRFNIDDTGAVINIY